MSAHPSMQSFFGEAHVKVTFISLISPCLLRAHLDSLEALISQTFGLRSLLDLFCLLSLLYCCNSVNILHP